MFIMRQTVGGKIARNNSRWLAIRENVLQYVSNRAVARRATTVEREHSEKAGTVLRSVSGNRVALERAGAIDAEPAYQLVRNSVRAALFAEAGNLSTRRDDRLVQEFRCQARAPVSMKPECFLETLPVDRLVD
jgi:hypothetical protein